MCYCGNMRGSYLSHADVITYRNLNHLKLYDTSGFEFNFESYVFIIFIVNNS